MMATAPLQQVQQLQALKKILPWIKTPFVISAPMRVFAGPTLATAVTRAGGLGFIGPGVRPADLDDKLSRARDQLRSYASPQIVDGVASQTKTSSKETNPKHDDQLLPVGVGFQLFDGDLSVACAAVEKYRPAVAWLFAPGNGQRDLDTWAQQIRAASSNTQIWIQVGSVAEAVAAAKGLSPPDVLVLQGSDAGGHGLVRGAGVISLLPEVADALKGVAEMPLVAAGGIADGRGVAAALAMGAVGAVMGTRFLASAEAEIAKGYQDDILRTADGGQNTVRTPLFDALTGRDDWPREYDGRSIVNQSIRDHRAGMPLEKNKELFREALKKGDGGWGPDGRLTSYVGSAVGLIREVEPAGSILHKTRLQAKEALQNAVGMV